MTPLASGPNHELGLAVLSAGQVRTIHGFRQHVPDIRLSQAGMLNDCHKGSFTQ
jgi:hypothetical protein